MTPTQPSNLKPNRRRRRRLLLGSAAAVLFALIALSIALLSRSLAPRAPAVLRLTPAAAAVDEQTKLLLSGSGWRSGEEVAICAASTRDSVCDAQSAFERVKADRRGDIAVEVLAGPLLGQGLTTFIASGLDSGQTASRAFRQLRTADDTSAIASRPAPDSVTPEAFPPLTQTVAVALPAVQSGDGTSQPSTPYADWRGEYFDNPGLSGEPVLVRNDGAVQFDWGEDSPVPGIIPVDAFSARWTRTLPFAEGSYRFSITANDGGRLLVDNRIVIDLWSGPSDQVVTADLPLAQGDHQITMQFVDNAGPARVGVGWSPIAASTPAIGAGTPFPAQTPPPPQTPGGSPTPTATAPASTGTPGATQPTDTPTSTGTPGPSPTPTHTITPGPSPTPTPTITPGPSPTPTPTITPGPSPTPTYTPTPTPSPSTTVAPLLQIGLDPAEGPFDALVEVQISGQWTPGARVEISLVPFGVPLQPRPSPNLIVSTGASVIASNDGSAVETQFRVPANPLFAPEQRIQVVAHTEDWTEAISEEFYITSS